MTARQRILTARLMEKLKKHPEYLEALGLNVEFTEIREPEENSKK